MHCVITDDTIDYTRDIKYTWKLEGNDKCESNDTPPGWYHYDDNHFIPTQPVLSGQCGSSSPIYLINLSL
jgi:hypothetical protein